MTRLQEEIQQAIDSVPLIKADGDLLQDNYSGYAKAASEVAIRWIEKAFEAGREYELYELYKTKPNKDQWLLENNLIEK